MAYIKEVCVTGKVTEVRKVVSFRYGKRSARKKNTTPTPDAVKKNNERQAEMKLRRLLNTNFGEGDLWVTLTYDRKKTEDGKAPDLETAKTNLQKFLRKAREQSRKEGKELKYIAATEYKGRRIHHHVVLSRISIDALPKIWPHGRPHFKLLDDSGQYADLAAYLIKETNRTFKSGEPGCSGKRWCQSRNLKPYDSLKKEVVTAREWRKTVKPLKGYVLDKAHSEEGVFERDGYLYPYQFYSMVRVLDG